jgi:methionyl-tRNA formyltransferase
MAGQITLFLMTQKGLDVLEALAERDAGQIDRVVAARDPNVRQDYYDEIRDCCRSHGIEFHDRQEAGSVGSPYAIAVSWRWLLALPSTRLIVFHDSLLPRYRGFNPLVSALINGDSRIGVTALFASDEYDAGDVIAQQAVEIAYPIKVEEAIRRLGGCYRLLARELAEAIARDGPLAGTPQDPRQATFSLWRDEDDYRIAWSQTAGQIKRFVDAVGFPYRGASTLVDGRKLRVLDAEVRDDVPIENRTPGKVIFLESACPVVVCGAGLLRITGLADDQTGQSLLPLKKFRTRFT